MDEANREDARSESQAPADIRDGERLPDVRGKEAYRQANGQIALWDGERHVLIGPNREGLRVALSQMKLAREYANRS